MENKKREIAEFYAKIFSDTNLKGKLEEKAKAIVTEEDLKNLIQQEIVPLMKKYNVNFSEKELLEYEEESLKKLSEEDLGNVSGGISIKSALLSGGLLSVGLLSGVGLSSTTHAMQVETVSTPEQGGQSGAARNSQHNDNDNGNSNANDNENAGNSTNFKFNLQDAHYTQFRRLMNNTGNQLHGLLKYFEKNSVKTKEDSLDFLENLRQQDPESFERIRSDVSHLASQIGQFGQDKILIGRWIPDNRFLPEELQLIIDVDHSFITIENRLRGTSSENENSDTLFNNNDINNEDSRQNLTVPFTDKSATESQSQNNSVNNDSNDNDNNNNNNNNNDINNEDNQITASDICGEGVHWSLDANGIFKVFGAGRMFDTFAFRSYAKYLPNIKNIIVEKQITHIGRAAFSDCKNLEEVTILGKVGAIEEWTFSGCDSLEHIVIPNGTDIIETWAFARCKNLKSVHFPASLNSIKWQAFLGCNSLQEISVDENNPNFFSKDGAIYSKDGKTLINFLDYTKKSFIIPENVTSIDENAFCDCRTLESISIPASVISIGDNAFSSSSCPNLKEITVDENNPSFCDIDGTLYKKNEDKTLTLIRYPAGKTENYSIVPSSYFSNLTSIKEYAFHGCDKLKSIDMQEAQKVTSIPQYAFSDCSNLINISLPTNIKSIEKKAFYNCEKLERIDIPSEVTSIGKAAFEDCKRLTNIELPDKVTSIGAMAFSECTKLKEIKIPTELTKIEGWTFRGCLNLEKVNIPPTSKLTTIGKSAFRYCQSLEKVNIPPTSKLTTIEQNAFEGCLSLTSVAIPESVVVIGRDAFNDCTKLVCVELNNIKGPVNIDIIKNLMKESFRGCSNVSVFVANEKINL